MTKEEKFLIKHRDLVIEFRKEFQALIESLNVYEPERRKSTIFGYWREAIKICESSGQKSNWNGLKLFFETLEIPVENRITEQEYQSIING